MPCDMALALQSFFFGFKVGRNFVLLFYSIQELADTFGYIAKFLEPVDHERNLIEHCHALLCGHSV